MELSHYGRFFKRHLGLILGTAILVGAVAGIVSGIQKEHAQATSSVILKVKDARPLTEYDYDQYYIVQATDLYSANVVSWLNSAQVRDDIRRAAGTDTGRVTGKKNGGTIEITTEATDSAKAVALAKSADDLIVSRTAELAAGPARSSFQAVPSQPAATTVKPSPVRDGVIGFVAGLVLGLVFALIAEAATPRRRTR